MISSSTFKNESIQVFKNDNIYTIKMITSSTYKIDNIHYFKNDNIYTMKNENILYTRKWWHLGLQKL